MVNQGKLRRALIIDDDPDTLSLLRTLCLEAGVAVDEAVDGNSGLARAREHPPDLILLDMVLPDASGVEITQLLRSDPRFAGTPIVIVSARRDQGSKVAAFEAGVNDYVLKPFDLQEFIARVRSQLHNCELLERLERSNLELRMANARLEELATTDELTGLANARHLRARLDEEFQRAERYEMPLSLVMADLDGFKAVNDRHGHHAGDRLLAQIAQRLGAQARRSDIVCRYGGDEFAFLLPHTMLSEARNFAQRLCTRIASSPLRLPGGGVAPIALSCGVASWPETAGITIAKELFTVADAALYQAKAELKGGVMVAPLADRPVFEIRNDPQKRWPRASRPRGGVEVAGRGEG